MTETLSRTDAAPPTGIGASPLPDEDQLARNFIGGAWRFPAAPYEYEIRSPRTSAIAAVVPLSSRLDVVAAVRHARAALPAWHADIALRRRVLVGLLDDVEASTEQLAAFQAEESGLHPDDARRSVVATVAALRRHLAAPDAWHADASSGEVSAAILGWGLPFVEAALAVVPALARGDVVVVKPSLRAPLSAAALACLLQARDLPPGVLNVVQGTAQDVGAALAGDRGIDRVEVRGAPATADHVQRAVRMSRARVRALHGGGNVVLVGPGRDALDRFGSLAQRLVEEVRTSAGPIGVGTVLLPTGSLDAGLDLLQEALAAAAPATPLPTGIDRQRLLGRLASFPAEALRVGVANADGLPDDSAHRMGWLVPPALVVRPLADVLDTDDVLPGPVVSVAEYRAEHGHGAAEALDGTFTRPRFAHGVLTVVGLDGPDRLDARVGRPLFPGLVGTGTAWQHFDRGDLARGWVSRP